MEKLAALLEQCARGDYSPREFLNRAKRELTVSHQATFDGLRALYESIHKLEKQNRNGIWARWLKNAFAPLFKGKFDFIAGNPPWINWESLANDYREASGPLWIKHGLVAKASGKQFELGKVKQDFATLFVYSAMESYLKKSGKLGFLITQTTFKTKSAERFRRFRLGSGVPLRVVVAEDLVEIQPFEGASNWTGLLVLQRDHATTYPVKYVLWRKKGAGAFETDLPVEEALGAAERYELVAEPIEQNDPTSPWLALRRSAVQAARKVCGKSSYSALEGCNALGGSSILWVRVLERRPDGLLTVENLPELAKKKVPKRTVPVEPALIHPLLKWGDNSRWFANARQHVVFPHTPDTGWQAISEATMKTNYPNTYKYLAEFRRELLGRSGYIQLRQGHPFYIMGNTNQEIHTPIKVVWGRMGSRINAAVVGLSRNKSVGTKPVLPQETLTYVPLTDNNEAHYLCAVLNTTMVTLVARSYSVGKSFGSPHLLQQVAIPKFSAKDQIHLRLAELSHRAHELAAGLAAKPDDKEAKRELEKVEDQIDHAAAKLWGLTDTELVEIRKALELLK
jgi:hypothetical protein